jgi:hypothetical protein
MQEHSTTQSVLFPDLFNKPVTIKFDQEHSSSDGGAILLKACDERLQLSERLASQILDTRQQGKVEHSIQDLVRQRLYAIACGYPDCNDAKQLSQDPIHKMLVGKDPLGEEHLASQATLSRFENVLSRADVYRACEELAEIVVERHRQRFNGQKVTKISIDLDPTDDPTHGGQQLSFFNGHYDCWCCATRRVRVTTDRRSMDPTLPWVVAYLDMRHWRYEARETRYQMPGSGTGGHRTARGDDYWQLQPV